MGEKNKSGIAKVILLVVALIVLGVSSSYAYYSIVITGTPNTTTLKSGKLDISTNLTSVSAINNAKLFLINAADKASKAESVSFYVQNTSSSTVSAQYYIYLRNINISKNLYSKYFKWELLRNGTVVASGNFASATRTSSSSSTEASNVSTTASDITLTTSALSIAKNTKDTLIFRLWLENDSTVNQISLTEGSFSGKLYLEAVPVSSNN